ncbi:hypothetical protein D1J51_02875 [Leucobacter sp. wl10]|nr:hypothetical protein D1J51_02875 [Leucobacter sp. wl10]
MRGWAGRARCCSEPGRRGRRERGVFYSSERRRRNEDPPRLVEEIAPGAVPVFGRITRDPRAARGR